MKNVLPKEHQGKASRKRDDYLTRLLGDSVGQKATLLLGNRASQLQESNGGKEEPLSKGFSNNGSTFLDVDPNGCPQIDGQASQEFKLDDQNQRSRVRSLNRSYVGRGPVAYSFKNISFSQQSDFSKSKMEINQGSPTKLPFIKIEEDPLLLSSTDQFRVQPKTTKQAAMPSRYSASKEPINPTPINIFRRKQGSVPPPPLTIGPETDIAGVRSSLKNIQTDQSVSLFSPTSKFMPNTTKAFNSQLSPSGTSRMEFGNSKVKFMRPVFLDKMDELLNVSVQSPLMKGGTSEVERKHKKKENERVQDDIKNLEIRIKQRKREIEKQKLDNQTQSKQLADHQELSQKIQSKLEAGKRQSNMESAKSEAIDSAGTPGKTMQIHSMYEMLFKTDLASVKERTHDQVSSVKQRQDQQQRDIESMRVENLQLEKTLKRYKEMLSDISAKSAKKPKGGNHGLMSHSETLQLQEDSLSQDTNSLEGDNQEYIDHKLFKYGENAPQVFEKNNTSVSLSNAAPAFMELIKLEKFSMTWVPLHKLAQPMDFLLGLLSEIKNIFKPLKCTLFVLDKALQQRIFLNKDKKRNFKRLLLNQTVVYAVFVLEDDFSPPSFKSVDEASKLSRTANVMVVPIKKQTKKVSMSIQLEVDLSQEKKELSQIRTGKTRKKLPMHLSQGWNYNDQILLRIICEFASIKLDVLYMEILKDEKNKKILEIIRFAREMMRRKTYRQLIKGLTKEICTLFEFEECGILFFDTKLQELFTVAANSDLPELGATAPVVIEEKVPPKKKGDAKKKSEVKVPLEQSSDLSFKIEEELIFPVESVVKFPSTVGITGQMFKTCGVKFSNSWNEPPLTLEESLKLQNKFNSLNSTLTVSDFQKKKQEAVFNSDVDNYIGVKLVKNYVIASMNEEDVREKTHSVGVIQLFNKEGGSKIQKNDIERIQSLQKFLGAAATRVSIFTSSLTVMIGLSMISEGTLSGMKQLESEVTQQLNDTQAVMLPLESLKKHLEAYANELGY